MHYQEKNELDQLLKHLGHVSWLARLYQYDGSHLLVMDKDLIEKIHGARKFPLKSKTATPDNFSSQISSEIKKVLVFCRSGELAIVRKIVKDHPDILVTSGTYGHILFGPDREARMIPYTSSKKGVKPYRPIIVLSAPYADAEFIINTITKHGGDHFHEYFSRPYASWLSLSEKFQVSRLMGAVLARFLKGGELRMVLQVDVLEALFKHTSVSMRHFIQYLEKNNAKVLVVKRRDLMVQAVYGQLLDRTHERSIWTKKQKRNIAVEYASGDFAGILKRYDALPAQEGLLNQVASAEINCEVVYLEDFISDQEAMLPKLAAFLETGISKKIQSQDYREGFQGSNNLLRAISQFRSEYLDRTGFHMASFEQG